MIELHDIFAIVTCISLALALIALAITTFMKAERHKKTENQLRAEIERLKTELTRSSQAPSASASETRNADYILPPPSKGKDETRLSARESRMMSLLNETVELHYTDPEFGVDELAAALDMSRSSLNRRMRETLKTTANNYIREVRINKAEELLRSSSLQINEICYKVGFQTPSYFIKCFRKKYGKSPNEYANSSK